MKQAKNIKKLYKNKGVSKIRAETLFKSSIKTENTEEGVLIDM